MPPARLETRVRGVTLRSPQQGKPMTPHYPRLVHKIRVKLDTGALPVNEPTKRWVGYGRENLCDGCDEVISSAQIAHELDFENARAVRLHIGCASIYEAELRRRGHRRSHSA